MMREVGMMSIVDNLAGEKLRTRMTSSAVTGGNVSSTGPSQRGNDISLGTDADNTRNLSLTESRSLATSLSTTARLDGPSSRVFKMTPLFTSREHGQDSVCRA